MKKTSMTKKDFFQSIGATVGPAFLYPAIERVFENPSLRFHLKKGRWVLDVGSGTGGIIPYILQNIGGPGLVWAIDFAEEMVRLGKEKFCQEPPHQVPNGRGGRSALCRSIFLTT